MKFCFDCNKVIQSYDDVLLHVGHNIGDKSFGEIYSDAVKKAQR